MSKIIGIDLGTTNSCVAVYEGGERVIIPNAQGGRTTPSVVAFTKDGERLIGETAKRQAAVNPDRTISSIKRDMGTERRISIDGKQYSPQEISAMILRQLKSDAETYLGEPVTEAVITVPAYFTDAQRRRPRMRARLPVCMSSASSMSRHPPRWRMALTKSRHRKFSSMTWAAARLMCPCSTSTTA